jgi:glutamate dehydrogenase
LFDENYGLASTQALKNKDIPEGGSKGVILPDIGATPFVVFQKYVDSIMDLLLPGVSPGIKEQVVDLYKKEEIVRRLSFALSALSRADFRLLSSAFLWT